MNGFFKLLTSHWQAAQGAARQLVQQPWGTLLSLLVLGCALALPLSLHLVLSSLTQATSRLSSDAEINVFLDPGQSLEEARALQVKLAALSGVSSARLVTKEAALAQLRQRPHLADLVASLETNPLPHAVVLRPARSTSEDIASLRSSASALEGVDKVSADFEWVQKLNQVTRAGRQLVFMLGLVLGLAVVLMVANTIRLEVLTRRDEIEVSQLIGASASFLRRPFLYFGALAGLGSAALGTGLSVLLAIWSNQQMLPLSTAYGLDFSVRMPTVMEACAYIFGVAALALMGAMASATAISWHSSHR